MSPDADLGIDVLGAVDGAWDHLVVGTYNADLQFFEYAVLPRTSGVRNAVIVVDDDMLDESFEMLTHGQSLRRVNSRYLVAPCRAIGAAHAKWILLATDDRARLLIGSGNLTYSGYARDVEVFTRFDIDRETPDHAQAFTALRSLLRQLVLERRLPERAAAQLALIWKALHWIPDEPSPSPTRIVHNATQPLADQFIDAVPTKVDRLTVYAPFWDHTCAALEQLVAGLRPEAVRVLLQPGLTTVDPLQLDRVLGLVDRPTETVPVDTTRGVIHAKLFAAEHHGQVTLLAGSPNASAAALSRTITSGNTELATITVLEHEVFAGLIAKLEPRASQPATTMGLRAPQLADDDAEPGPELRIGSATWDGASLALHLAGTQLDREIEVTVGGHGPWTVAVETGNASLVPDLATKERLEAGSWIRARPSPTASWSPPTCPVRTHHLDHQLEAAPGRQAAFRRVITGHPEVSDDIAALLTEVERTLVLTPQAIRRLAARSTVIKVDATEHDTFDDLETLWASLSAHPNVVQYAELDLQTEVAGPPSDLAVLLAALGARFPQPVDGAAPSATVEVDAKGDPADLPDELVEDGDESEEERAARLADYAKQRNELVMNARRHYGRFFDRVCTAYENPLFREVLTPQMVAAQVVVLTDLTSKLLAEDLATSGDVTGWLVRLWQAAFDGTGRESGSASEVTELREHLVARGWTASFVVSLTRIADASIRFPSAAALPRLRAAAHRVIAHDACPTLTAEDLDHLATELDTRTVVEAWTRIDDVLSRLSQDEVRRDLERAAGLVEHSAAFRRVKVHRESLGDRHEEQLELPESLAIADEELVVALVALWMVLDPSRDYYRVFVSETKSRPRVVAVFDRELEDAWVASDGEVVDIMDLPDQRPAWRRWLDEANPTES